MFEDQLEELLDYVFGKAPDVYAIYNTITGYTFRGTKEFIEDYIDFLYESFQEWPDEARGTKIKVARDDVNIESLRNVDNEIVLALIY